MVVSWLTGVQTPTSTVKFGTVSGTYTNAGNGTSASYYKDNYVHHVVLTGLQPATKYYYVCGDEEVSAPLPLDDVGIRDSLLGPRVCQAGFSSEFYFTSPPTSSTRSFSVMVYGDMGTDNSGSNTQQIIAHKDDVDFVYHIGDYAYADDRLTTDVRAVVRCAARRLRDRAVVATLTLHHRSLYQDYDKTWNEWANQIQPVAAYKAYMAMPGNHEATCHSFGDFFCPDGLKNFSACVRPPSGNR